LDFVLWQGVRSAESVAYGLLADGDAKTVQRLWSGFLEQHGNDRIARALLALQRDDPIKVYRKLERKTVDALNPAQRWLRAELAHAAKLDGLAFEQMQALADDHSLGFTLWTVVWQSARFINRLCRYQWH